MVDSVKSAISRMETVKMRRADAAESRASATAPKPSGKTDSDSVELKSAEMAIAARDMASVAPVDMDKVCLLYTSPSPRDRSLSRMPSSA